MLIASLIERIHWRQPAIGELRSPFQRGKGERSLRVTFHTSSLVNLSGEAETAVRLLRELSHLPEFEALETESGSLPHIEIGDPDIDHDIIPVRVHAEDGTTYTGIWLAHQWPEIAARLVGQGDPNHEDAKAMLVDLIVGQAHCAAKGDVLVTSSPLLLGRRTTSSVSEANPLTPIEAAAIVGLFLRSRGIYVLGDRSFPQLDRWFFYWPLVRYRLPSMWQYLSICQTAEQARGDDTFDLGYSILLRCVRALQARDAIGEQFYVPQNNETRDNMMYHFDYLTLNLAGALDIQARVAHRAHNLGIREQYATFRQLDFIKRLSGAGAVHLCQIVADKRFKDFETLLRQPRNTIHAAALTTLAYQSGSGPETSWVRVHEPMATELWASAERQGSAWRWGLTQGSREVLLEPYSYASALVDEGLRFIDAIAATTELQGLLPVGTPMPRASGVPSTHPLDPFDPFDQRTGERLALLGGLHPQT